MRPVDCDAALTSAPERRPTILAVDDESVILRWLSVALDAWGYRVVVADSAQTALWSLADLEIDAVILDVRLPGTRSGLDVLAAIRSDPAKGATPVLVLTGAELREPEQELARRLGAFVFYKIEGVRPVAEKLAELLGRPGPPPAG